MTARSDHLRQGQGPDRRQITISWRNTKIPAASGRPERLFRAMQEAMRPQRMKFQAIHRGGSDA